MNFNNFKYVNLTVQLISHCVDITKDLDNRMVNRLIKYKVP